jgi:hypothetical protein
MFAVLPLGFDEESEEGIMNVVAGDTSETLDVLLSHLLIEDEKRVFETSWRVGVTISNIHNHFSRKFVVRERGLPLLFRSIIVTSAGDSGGSPCDTTRIPVLHLWMVV